MFRDALVIGISALWAFTARAETVSVGVGMVRNQVITSREVQIYSFLEAALYERAPKSKIKPLALDSKAFSKAVQDTLLETAVAREAQSFNLMQVSPEELRTAEKTVLKAMKGVPAWMKLEVSPEELQKLIGRKIQAKKFIQFRADSSILPVTDSEAQRYFQENRLKFGDLPFENFKENIKSYLGKAQLEKRLKDWFDVLLSKYQVKNLIAEI